MTVSAISRQTQCPYKAYSKWVLVTPNVASEFLTKSIGNRKLSRLDIKRYAEDIKTGKYVDSPNTIGFDCEGSLIDGHHRLHAVIEAAVSAWMLVTYDLSLDARKYADSGRNRAFYDQLHMIENVDVSEAHPLTGVIRALNHLQSGEPTRIGYSLYESAIQNHSESFEWLSRVNGWTATVDGKRIKHGFLAAFAYAFPIEPKFIDEFFSDVTSMNVSKSSAVKQAVHLCVMSSMKGGGHGAPQQVRKMLRAFVGGLANETMKNTPTDTAVGYDYFRFMRTELSLYLHQAEIDSPIPVSSKLQLKKLGLV